MRSVSKTLQAMICTAILQLTLADVKKNAGLVQQQQQHENEAILHFNRGALRPKAGTGASRSMGTYFMRGADTAVSQEHDASARHKKSMDDSEGSSMYIAVIRDASAIILFSMAANLLIISSTCSTRSTRALVDVHDAGGGGNAVCKKARNEHRKLLDDVWRFCSMFSTREKEDSIPLSPCVDCGVAAGMVQVDNVLPHEQAKKHRPVPSSVASKKRCVGVQILNPHHSAIKLHHGNVSSNGSNQQDRNDHVRNQHGFPDEKKNKLVRADGLEENHCAAMELPDQGSMFAGMHALRDCRHHCPKKMHASPHPTIAMPISFHQGDIDFQIALMASASTDGFFGRHGQM